jgi:predicted transcriptional regulator of viral defense system
VFGAQTPEERIFSLLKSRGVVRARDLEALGISRYWLDKLRARGDLVRPCRGLYYLPRADRSANHSLALVARRISHGIVCLVSALRFHELTTQLPHKVWLAVDRKARKPSVTDLPVHFVRFGGEAFTAGVEEHLIDEVPVKIYSAAKTVADCFKYRNKIGKDVAIEALRDCRRQRKASINDLWRMAEVCRVAHIMLPYLEAGE